jgi:hypothetical protein
VSKPDAVRRLGRRPAGPDIFFWGNWGDSGNSLYVHTGCNIGHVEEMVGVLLLEKKEMAVRHVYLSDWRKANGHTVKSLE